LRAEWSDADVLEVFAWAIREALAAAPDADAVGVGIPSRIEWPAGVSVGAAHLPLEGVPFRDLLAERSGLPVYVDNDANLAALAEHRAGAAKGTSEALMITIGTGIGGGLILGGRLYRGATGAAGEIGHMTIDFDGPPCHGDCPGRGCFETYVSGPALARAGSEAAQRIPESALAQAGEIDGALVTRLALDGDPAAVEAVAEVGRHLGAGIAGLLNVFEPEVVVVGGGLSAAGDLLLEPARAVARERALAPAATTARIEAARFQDEAGMVGGALLALAGGDV
jgi:glucokinase